MLTNVLTLLLASMLLISEDAAQRMWAGVYPPPTVPEQITLA